MMKALDSIPTFDLRLRRAEGIASFLWRQVRSYVPDDDQNHAYRSLVEAPREIGADLITDADRAAAGLPARGSSGLTADEMWAIEVRRTQALLEPMTTLAPTPPPEERYTSPET